MADATTKEGASTAEVDAFLAALDHPRKAEILALRRIILDADPSISEGIKWNAPSFRTSEWFATFHLRAKDGVQVILHLGAKRREDANPRAAIDDPESLLEWLAEDRASVKLRDMNEVDARRIALKSLIRQWIGEIRP
ncbi:MAG TPA: DUF1801 domain-containing protein [Longimicrobium sp.]|nr:DUF1801 domain-containing protein [Longimicrobium sp.]